MNTIIYEKCGTGPNILFLHGWLQDRHTWDGIVEQLKQDFTCWAVDLPGFGQTPRPKGTWTPADYATWVGEFIQQNQINDVAVVGHSFGGRVAICLTSSLSSQIVADERGIPNEKDSTVANAPWNDKKEKNDSRFTIHVSRLVLYATPGFREPLPRFTTFTQALAKAMKKSGVPLNRLPGYERLKIKFQSSDAATSSDLQDIFQATIEFDLLPAMKKISLPTLLLWGEKDVEVPFKIGEAMHQVIADAVVKLIPNGTHFAHLENPTLFAGIIKDFLSSRS